MSFLSAATALVDTSPRVIPTMMPPFLSTVSDLWLPHPTCPGLTAGHGLVVLLVGASLPPPLCFVLNCGTRFILLTLALIGYIRGRIVVCVLCRLNVFVSTGAFQNFFYFVFLQCLRDQARDVTTSFRR